MNKYSSKLVCILAILSVVGIVMGQVEKLGSEIEDVESAFIACRRDPTWSSVDYDMCQKLTGWKPRDNLWKKQLESGWIKQNGKQIQECLKNAFENAKQEYDWSR